ncbi:MAG: hypothetical protein J5775_00395 [Spirochaetales bacterium]|nr:hypothetical protein [Spirochaetales bacterium]
MKRMIAVIVMLVSVLACVFAYEGTVTWTWYENDPKVEYYRYQVDAQNDDGWTVVDKYAYEVSIVLDVSVLHTLYLQQSYDGIIWSESSAADSEVFLEPEPVEEEPVPEEVVEPVEEPEEVVPEEPVEEVPEEPVEIYIPKNTVDVGFGYMNYIPDSAGAKNVGIVVSYSRPLFSWNVFDLGVKVNLALYANKNLILDIKNTVLTPYVDLMAQASFKVASSDIYLALGADASKILTEGTRYNLGLAAEIGVRYHRSEKFTVGFAVADHYYLLPLSQRMNRMDLKAFLSWAF